MKFSIRMTQLQIDKRDFTMMSLLSEDEKKSTCTQLIQGLGLQQHVVLEGSRLFQQGVRLLFPESLLATLSTQLEALKVSFTTPLLDMLVIDDIDETQIKQLLNSQNTPAKSATPAVPG